MDGETSAPADYPYHWSASHDLSIDAFLSKYKPSMVQDDGTKPWIWVEKDADGGRIDAEKRLKAVAEARECLEEATNRVEEIKNDDKIPARSSKKTGAKGKKEVREEFQAEVTAKLKQISQENEYTVGKWLFFPSPDNIDGMWTKLAKSLITGPLSQTPAFLAKAATFRPEQHTQLIALYVPDLYDRDAATEVLRTLVRSCGLTPSTAKSDLYTYINLDSKHPSGIRSSVWQTKELLADDEIKKLRDEYNAEQEAAKPRKKPAVAHDRDDPFADDDEDENEEEEAAPSKATNSKPGDVEEKKTKPVAKAKTAPTTKSSAKRKAQPLEEDEDEDEVEDQPAKKTKKAPATKPASKRKAPKDEDEDEVEEKAAKKSKKAPPRNAVLDDDDYEDEKVAQDEDMDKDDKPALKPKAPKVKEKKVDENGETETETESDEEVVVGKPVKPPAPVPAKPVAPGGAGRLGKLKGARSKYDD